VGGRSKTRRTYSLSDQIRSDQGEGERGGKKREREGVFVAYSLRKSEQGGRIDVALLSMRDKSESHSQRMGREVRRLNQHEGVKV
jgi:hypothetical protein